MKQEDIKVYKMQDNSLRGSLELKRMEQIFDERSGEPDTPHRHRYYTVLFAEKAKGKHRIDFREYDLAAKQIFFINPGQVHQVINQERPLGWVLTFSKDFLMQNGIRADFISDLNVFRDYGDAPPLVYDEPSGAKLTQFLELIQSYLAAALQPYTYEAVGALLKLFLIECNQLCDLGKEQHTQANQVSLQRLRQFRKLVNQHYKKYHKVSDYAKLMTISGDYLNKTIRHLTGKSAKSYIQSRITTEAKRSLLFSDMTNKELAYDLGFDEPSHFSAFFKNCVGLSPTAFRKQKNLP